MRIVIEIDGTAVKPTEAGIMPSAPEAATEPADGGAAPGADAASGAADSDSGGPAQDLLDAVGRAERGAIDGTPPADATDAGAGPTPF